MFKILSTTKRSYLPVVIPMHRMAPLEVGRTENGELVMRTASKDDFEVMDLSSPGPDSCWEGDPELSVTLLNPDERVTIELFNK